MLICGHHIDPLEIIGIGPLMVDRRGQTKQLFFMLYLKQYTLKIESVAIDLEKSDSQIKWQETEYDKFSKDYKANTAIISRRIAARTRKNDRPVAIKKSNTK